MRSMKILFTLAAITAMSAPITVTAETADAAANKSSKKIAIVVRQYDVFGASGFRGKAFPQPMVWHDPPARTAKTIGGSSGGFSISFTPTLIPQPDKKRTDKLVAAVGNMDITASVTESFTKQIQALPNVTLANPSEVQKIYATHCPAESMDKIFGARGKNREKEIACELQLKVNGIADSVIYVDIGKWGFNFRMAFNLKKKGHTAVYLESRLYDIGHEKGIAQGYGNVSYGDGKMRKKNELAIVEEFIGNDAQRFRAGITEQIPMATQMAIDELASHL